MIQKGGNFEACPYHYVSHGGGTTLPHLSGCINNKLKYNTRDKTHYITHILTFSIFCRGIFVSRVHLDNGADSGEILCGENSDHQLN